MANRKQVQKKITHKGGAINSVEREIERMNAHALLEYAKKVNLKRRIKVQDLKHLVELLTFFGKIDPQKHVDIINKCGLIKK